VFIAAMALFPHIRLTPADVGATPAPSAQPAPFIPTA
jgi:hypothetical protein